MTVMLLNVDVARGPSLMMILFALSSSSAFAKEDSAKEDSTKEDSAKEDSAKEDSAKEPHVGTSVVGNVNDPETAAAIGTNYRHSWSRIHLSPKSCMTSFRTHPSMTSSVGSLTVEVF